MFIHKNKELSMLRLYQKTYNNSYLNIVRFIPGTKGRKLKYEIKCPCGNYYGVEAEDIIDAHESGDYSELKCYSCDKKNIDYSNLWPIKKAVEPAAVEPAAVEPAAVEPEHKEIGRTKNPIMTKGLKAKLELLKFFQIYFKNIGWVENIEKYKIQNKVISSSKTVYNLQVICPGCFNRFKISHHTAYSRLHSKYGLTPLICTSCMTKRGNLAANVSNSFEEKIFYNIKNPLLAKSILPIVELKDIRTFRSSFDFGQIPNKITGFSESSVLYDSKSKNHVWFIGLQCPNCNEEFIKSRGSIYSRYNASNRLKPNGSKFLLCESCHSVFNHKVNDEKFQKNYNLDLTPKPFYDPVINFDREFFHKLIKSTEAFEPAQFFKRIEKIELGDIENITIDMELEVEPEVEPEVVKISKTQDVLDKLDEHLNSRVNTEYKNRFNPSISIFSQILNDSSFKTMLLEKVSDNVSKEYAKKILENDFQNIR